MKLRKEKYLKKVAVKEKKDNNINEQKKEIKINQKMKKTS